MLPRETLARLFVLEPIAGLRSRRIRSRACLHTDDIIPPFALSVSLQRWSGYLCNYCRSHMAGARNRHIL